ncbi:hypothetical protein SASC598J21_000090, partial [Snodgrassella alvi SCGC AB-598-J21]
SATLVSSLFIWALGIACLLSFNEWQDIKIFGKNIFDSLDYLTSKLMLPLTGLGTIVFAGWMMNQERIRQENKKYNTNNSTTDHIAESDR